MREIIEVEVLICPRCGHKWTPRVANPLKCPICQKKLGIRGK